MSVEQSNEDLQTHLKERIYFLRSSAKAYDEGNVSEAKRISTSIRVLVHDTSNSKSLLTQLNKKGIKYYDTAIKPIPGNQVSTTGLVTLQISNGKFSYVPRLDNTHSQIQKVGFDQWWNDSIIIVDKKGTQFKRSDLVLKMCNQDGGAHIGPSLNDAYADLSRSNSVGWKLNLDGNDQDLKGIESASIRQICHEMLKSLKDELPDYF